MIAIGITIVVGALLTVLLAQGLHRMGTGLAYYEELQAAGIDPQGPAAMEDYPDLRSVARRRGTLFALLTVLGTSVPLTALVSASLFFGARRDVPIWRLVVVSLGLTALSAAAIGLALPRIGAFGVAPGFIGGLSFWLVVSAATLFATVRRRRRQK
jgi:hypothetical protein